MTTSSSNNGSNKGRILTGNTILDKLLNQLSQDDREFVLRLMTELGIRADDPMHPLLVALQYYICLLRDIPEQMRSAAKDSMREALTTYGTIQTEIDNSVDRVKAQVDRVDDIREQWNQDAEALLPKLSTAFDTAKKTSIEAHQAEMRKNAETHLQDWAQELESTRKIYLADVLKQGLIWAGSAVTIALLAVGGTTYWIGTQHGRDGAVQNSYKAFGNQANYDFAKNLMNRSDNVQRFVKCQEEDNEKCTVWMKTPPQ